MSKKRILCVEDHPDICELVGLVLEGYEVDSAYSMADALYRASSEKYDLYLLDYHLPDGTGIELCLLLKNFDPDTPILFITSSSSLSRTQINTLGAQGIISKGANFVKALAAKVNELLVEIPPSPTEMESTWS